MLDARREEASAGLAGREFRPDGTLRGSSRYWRVADVAAEAADGPAADLRR